MYSLFGPRSVARQSVTSSLEQLLMNAPFEFDINNEEKEDTTILGIFNIMRENVDVMNPPTAAKMVLLARVVDKRFPVESHVTTVCKQRTDALSKQEKAQDTPRLVLRRLNKFSQKEEDAIS